MEGATLLCTRDPGWELKFKGPMPANSLMVPVGCFLARQGTRYHPTTHSFGRNDFYTGRMEVGLTRESVVLNAPLTLSVAGQGSVIVTNTGRATLRVGDRFTLEYPSPEDVSAQQECLKMCFVKHAHPNLEETRPMWGSMLATVPMANRWENLKLKVGDETAAGATSFLYTLGNLMNHMRAPGPNAIETYPQRYFINVTNGRQVDPAVAQNAVAGQQDHILESVRHADALVCQYQPKVQGIVQHALLGNSETLRPGMQFYAYVSFT